MAIGQVKWFSNTKGFGFIVPEGGGLDIFAHFSAIQMEGYRSLEAGDHVSYERVEGPKGASAQNIRLLHKAEESQPVGAHGCAQSPHAEATRA
jgi:CspA family cold shock protein